MLVRREKNAWWHAAATVVVVIVSFGTAHQPWRVVLDCGGDCGGVGGGGVEYGVLERV